MRIVPEITRHIVSAIKNRAAVFIETLLTGIQNTHRGMRHILRLKCLDGKKKN